ncbi:ribosomal protection-like ABC-F family protein [Anaerosacchariphilus polymeriproducens]|uniref:ABC-F type ribosomal protection protein n=1 Tax=Anaerosacchariphilus polymeriproducens TaxID=1812858 RepID=A0A371ATZ6_9FIRM|nr:ABC-F type ribosomal protection protein [Anaerosacchariphilus polymeriproducens]RDU23019.1 ABC-F type ribosomal protection protein [Anaerosacchariphilus polymeriproducens]
MLLLGQNIVKEYGIQTVLDIKKFEIHDGDRIGLIGPNGAGKSTFLDILCGEIPYEKGMIKCNCDIAKISQRGESDGISDGKFLSQMKLSQSMLKSGGEKTRLAIASAFSKHAALLLADEPTTNLDVNGIQTLENMLIGYKGAIVLVSHDRKLLDKVCNQIWELEDGELRIFPGNYNTWMKQKTREREFAEFEYGKYRNEKKRLEKTMRQVKQEAQKISKTPKKMSSSEWMLYKGNASIKQGRVQNRAKALKSRMEQLEEKERPKELPKVSMKFGEQQKMKAKVAARIDGLSIGYDNKVIVKDVKIQVLSGKKTFLTGDNGTGKTSIIRCLMNHEDYTFITSEAKVGYFSQNQENLDLEKTVLENVMTTAIVPEHICRAVLINLYMRENDFSKKIAILSGGERVKTAIAKLLVSGCNFIILDEPTNHLDIYAMEGLEKLLLEYEGTLLIVSHDRKMIENLADFIYEIKENQIFNIDKF